MNRQPLINSNQDQQETQQSNSQTRLNQPLQSLLNFQPGAAFNQAESQQSGIMLFLLHGVFQVVNYFAIQTTYSSSQELGHWQMYFARSFICTLMMAFYLNSSAKTVLFDSIHKEDMPNLLFRTFQGTTTVVIMCALFTMFASSTVLASACLQPILTVLLAGVLLRESLPIQQTMGIIAATAGAAMIILGYQNNQVQPDALPTSTWLTGLLFLVLSPLLQAGGTISTRQMRSVHHAVLPSYVNFTLMIGSMIALWSQGESIFFLGSLGFSSWFALVVMSVLMIMMQVSLQQALSRVECSNLQVFSFLPLLLQTIGEFLIIQKSLVGVQILGLLIIGTLLTVNVGNFMLEQKSRLVSDDFQKLN